MELFDTGDAQVRFDDVGDGPAIVFLHNGGTSSTIWRHQRADLADRHRVITLDLPGFGASPRPHPALTLEQLTHLVAGLLEDRGTGPVVVVGNCMGSNIAAGLAAERPDLVRGLVLINPLTAETFAAGRIGLLYTVERWAHGPSALGRRIMRRVATPKVLASATLRLQVGKKGVARGVHHDPELVACVTRTDQMAALIDVLDDMDAYRRLDDRLDLAGMPVCTIWGEQNRVLSPAAGRALDERLRPDRQVVLDGCGHLPMLEAPAEVTEAIVAFMAELDGAPADTAAVR